MQHVEGCPDPLLCSCIACADLMGQILALEALPNVESLHPGHFVVQPRSYNSLQSVAKALLLLKVVHPADDND